MKIRSRPVVYSAFIIALFVIVAYSRWNQIRNWFDRERVDPVALAELEKSNLSTAKPSEPNAGWPQWRGPNRDGVAPAGPFRTDLKTNPPKQLWTAPCGGGYGQPIVVDGKPLSA